MFKERINPTWIQFTKIHNIKKGKNGKNNKP